MDRVIRIVIADSDPGFGEMLAEHIGREADMQVCALAMDGLEALERVKSLKPDVLVTDLMLRKMEGLGLMRCLRACDALPRTIVVSGFLNANLVEKAGQQGAEYFFLKPCRIQSLIESIRDCMLSEATGLGEYMEELVGKLLISFGIMPHLNGYVYLRDAVVMISMGSMPLQGITKILYPDMAKSHHVTARDVERCIRHAIKHGWEGRETGGPDNHFTRTFRHKTKAPTNRELIAYLTARVKELLTLEERKIL